jgi:CheY-like chemotaxis protein
VLVVDDEELVRSMLVRYLERQGYQVQAAGDGRQALELFRESNFDLVLSDVRMPGLDGIQLLKALKEINPRVPVVLISGYGEVETVVAALKFGAENFLGKPLKMEALGKVIEQSLAISCLRYMGRPLVPQVRQVTYLEAPSRPELVCELVQQVTLSAVAVGYAQYDLDNNLKLALVEGITNAMEHGNKWDQAKMVKVESEATRDTLKVSIGDEGPGFDFAALPDPTSDERLFNERGRGVFLMRAIMDEVTYNPEGNRVTLSKRKPEHGQEQSQDHIRNEG